MGKVLDLFGGRSQPEPEPEPEPFDFEEEHFHIQGYLEDIAAANTVGEVKALLARLNEEVKGWPDG